MFITLNYDRTSKNGQKIEGQKIANYSTVEKGHFEIRYRIIDSWIADFNKFL